MANKIQLRRDTAEAWIEADPVLSQGEPGVEVDTGRLKIGNGEANWSELDYVGALQLPPDAQGYLVNDGDGNLSWGPGDGTFSGDYNDLTNAPTIPTDVNQLTDENGLLGGGGGGNSNELVNGDYTVTLDSDGDLNVPNNLIIGGDLTISSQGIRATNNTAGLTISGGEGGEGGANSYYDVEISTNRGEWTFENTGGLRFDDGSRQWTSASAIAEELPYSIDINTNTRRIVAYGTAQAEIDPGIMTPVSLPGSRDDNYITLNTLPFNVTFLNQSYSLLGVGSNSYVTFGGGTRNYSFGDDPTMGGANLPAIIISEADNSFQRIFTYATGSVGSQEFSIRYEGTNATGGTPGQSNIIWQLTFYENNANVISLLLIQDARSNDGISGITDGQNWQMETANNRTLPRLPWNQFAPRAIRFADSSISIDANNNATINIAGGGNVDLGAVGEHILPTTDITYDIGSPTKRFRDLYLSSNTLYLGDKSLSITDNKLEVGGFIFGEAGNVTGVAITQYENNIVSIRVSTGSDGDTIANSIVKGDKLKLNSPVNGLSVLTVVSTSGQVVVGYNEYTDYTITVAENKGSGLDNIEFNLIKPIFGGNYNDLTDAPTIPTDVSDLTDTTGLLGVGGASTGNIRFDNTWIKNVDTGNIYISPQDSFTYLDLPSDTQASAGSKVTLTNEAATGGVRIRAGQQGKKWDFNYDGSITFPDNKISQVSDSNLGIQTSKSLITDRIIANGSEFNTDQNVDGFGVINGWSQRNAQQIEMNLFVAPAPIWVLLTGLALGRTVIVTYSTGSGDQTFTGVLSQLFTATGQYDQFSRQRYSGRIDGTIPANQTGIVSINFPELSTQTNNWQFSDDGVLTLPANGDIVDSNGNSVLGGGGGIENDLIVSQNEETFINFNGNTGRAGNLVIGTNADQDVAISVYEGPGNTEKHWIFGSDGDLVLPEGKTIRNTDGDDLLAGSGGSTLLPPYKGFRAHYGTMYNNTDDNNGPINKIVIYRDSVSPSSAIDTDTSSDDFQVTGLTGSDVVAMLVIISDGTNWEPPTPTADLKTFAEAIIDNVILDDGVEGDFNNIAGMRSTFYDNFSNFNTIIGDVKTNFEFFENDFNVSAQTQTGGTGTGSGFIISNLQKQGNTIELSGWSNGSGYQVGDVFTILGTNITDNINNNPLASPDNDVTVTITGVDGNGAITTTSISGTLPNIWPSYYINDGGDDEYDGANAIHTNLETNIIYNSGAPIINSTAFGGGDYVVTYQAGIFGIFATGANIDVIGTSGEDGGYGNDNSSSGFDGDGVAVTGSLYGEGNQVESPTQITNTDGNDTYSVSVATTGVVTMTTSRGNLEFGALPEPGGTTHFHIMKGPGQDGSSGMDLYFGDDFNYVLQRPDSYNGSPAYGVEIGANDRDGGNQQVWRFETDGQLTLPQGSMLSEEGTSLYISPPTANPGQSLLIRPTANNEGSHIHLIAGESATTDLYLGDDNQYIKIEKSAGDVVIGTNSNANHWTFGDDGSLTLPQGSTIDEATEIVSVELNQFTDGGFPDSETFYKVSDTRYELIPGGPYMELISAIWYLKISVSTYYSSTDLITWETVAGGLPAPVGTLGTLVTMSLTANSNSWAFGTDGYLTLPADKGIRAPTNFTIEAQGTYYPGFGADARTGQATVYAHNNVVIRSHNHDDGQLDWTFGEDGKLTLPNGGIIDETQIKFVTISGGAISVLNQTYTKVDVNTYLGSNDCRIFTEPSNPDFGGKWRLREGLSNDRYESTDLVTWTIFVYNGTPQASNPTPTGTLSGATTNLTVGGNDWKFGDDGVLKVPGNISFNSDSVGLGNSIDLSWNVVISSGKDIKIKPGSSGVVGSTSWTFGEDALVFPGGSLISDKPIGERLTLAGAGLTVVNQTYTKTSATLYTGENGVTIEAIGGGVWFCIQGNDTKYSSTDNLVTWDNSTGGLPVPTSTLSAATTTLTVDNKEWKFDDDGKLTTPGNLQVDGGKIILNTGGNAYVESVDYGVNSANSAVNIFGGPYQKIKLRAGFGTQATWTLGTDGSLTLPQGSAIDETTGVSTNIKVNGKAWAFGTTGNLTLPAGGDILNSSGNSVLGTDRVTGSWTLASGANTVSLTVPINGTYSIWVRGNIPSGIVSYTATVVVSNDNVPVLGSSYGWYYAAGGALVLTAMPDQIIGTVNNISTTATIGRAIGNTANVFTFGITNNSGTTQVVDWGYTKL